MHYLGSYGGLLHAQYSHHNLKNSEASKYAFKKSLVSFLNKFKAHMQVLRHLKAYRVYKF